MATIRRIFHSYVDALGFVIVHLAVITYDFSYTPQYCHVLDQLHPVYVLNVRPWQT